MNENNENEKNGLKDSLLNKPKPDNRSTVASFKRPTKKIMLLGFNSVGKTSLAIKFLQDVFPNASSANSVVEENYKKMMTYKF